MAPILGYWNIRGIAEPIRFMLHHVGQEFEDKRYELGSTLENFKEAWFKVKGSFGFDFPNLPYFIDGDLKMTQCLAILRHLSRKHGLVPDKEEDRVRVDIAEQQGMEMLWAFILLVLNADFEKLRPDYVAKLGIQLDQLSKFLGERPFVAGDKVTHADFITYEVLDQVSYLEPSCLDSFPNLQAFLKRVEELPNIKKYRSSEAFKAWPLVGWTAQFGGKGTSPRV